MHTLIHMIRHCVRHNIGIAIVTFTCVTMSHRAVHAEWPLHVIDNSSRGADGVRLGDLNGDGRQDIVTGWEEGGRIRICLQPEPSESRKLWPSMEVGRVASPEDAVFVDVDSDGDLDVVSSCEGKEQSVYVHWNPTNGDPFDLKRPWKTEAVPRSVKNQQWMFCVPIIDSSGSLQHLVTGSKGSKAAIGRWQIGENRRQLNDWKWQSLRQAGWLMSLIDHDMDGDGDADVLFSDRKGDRRGIYWLEQPGPDSCSVWKEHAVGGADSEVMFLKIGQLDSDAPEEIVTAIRGGPVTVFERESAKAAVWSIGTTIQPVGTGTGKGIGLGDLNHDGTIDIVMSCENSQNKHGVVAFLRQTGGADRAGTAGFPGTWSQLEISGNNRGIKFDRIEMIDIDQDGDLDVLTCEERDNLGVVWYENPHLPQK